MNKTTEVQNFLKIYLMQNSGIYLILSVYYALKSAFFAKFANNFII